MSTLGRLLGSSLKLATATRVLHRGLSIKASAEQLHNLETKLVHMLPKFFSSPHDYTIYTKDVILVDNIRGTWAQGLAQYALTLNMVKFYHAFRFSINRIEILNLVKNAEESYIRIRWRIISSPGNLRMWRFYWKAKKIDQWKDGISTLHVNKDGKIFCHVCDNIDLQTETSTVKQEPSLKTPLVDRDLNV